MKIDLVKMNIIPTNKRKWLLMQYFFALDGVFIYQQGHKVFDCVPIFRKHIRYDTISQQEMQVIVYSANRLPTTRHAKFSCSRLDYFLKLLPVSKSLIRIFIEHICTMNISEVVICISEFYRKTAKEVFSL